MKLRSDTPCSVVGSKDSGGQVQIASGVAAKIHAQKMEAPGAKQRLVFLYACSPSRHTSVGHLARGYGAGSGSRHCVDSSPAFWRGDWVHPLNYLPRCCTSLAVSLNTSPRGRNRQKYRFSERPLVHPVRGLSNVVLTSCICGLICQECPKTKGATRRPTERVRARYARSVPSSAPGH